MRGTITKAFRAGRYNRCQSRCLSEIALHLPFEDLLLGAEPVLFVAAGFTTAAFIQLIGPVSYPVL